MPAGSRGVLPARGGPRRRGPVVLRGFGGARSHPGVQHGRLLPERVRVGGGALGPVRRELRGRDDAARGGVHCKERHCGPLAGGVRERSQGIRSHAGALQHAGERRRCPTFPRPIGP
eukprot:3528497-Pyramimonas_sp.AAC.1